MNAMWNWLQSLLPGKGGRPGPRGARRPSRPRRSFGLRLEQLESRLTPASFFFKNSAGALSIVLDAGENLTVSESGGTRVFTLSSGRWFFLGDDPPTSVSGQTLTFDATRNLSGSLTIAGGVGTNDVTFAGGTINSNQVFVDVGTASLSDGTISFTTATTSFTGVVSLNFIARGNILQTAPITTTAPATFVTNASLINLNNPLNDFIGPVSVANQGSVGVSLSDANSLTVQSVNMDTGPLTVQAAGQVNFVGPWTFRLNKGGPSFQVVINAGATGVSLSGAALAGTAAGFLPSDTVVLVNNLSAAPISGGFTNGSSATLGTTVFQIGVNAGTGNKNVVLTSEGTRNQVYVSNLYAVLLERPADPGGLAGWSQQLDLGASPRQVVAGLMASPEYQTLQVNRVYQTYLHRAPDPSGLSGGIQFLQHGGTVRDLKMSVIGSAEYFQARGGGTNDGWLAAVFEDLLGRPVDPGSQQYFGPLLAMGAPRVNVALGIYLGPEAATRLVEQFYPQYLGRPADPSGLQAAAAQISAGASEESVITTLVTSTEFYNRPLIPSG
jgi:hypothetical protein